MPPRTLIKVQHRSFSQRTIACPHSEPGFALVLVLILLALATTMAVFFLSSVGRERRAVSLYAQENAVRDFAGMTVNRVMGQINAATKEGTAAVPVSWASQPGMVRTYDSSGDPSKVYKLYSWDTLFDEAGDFDPTSQSELPPADWTGQPALYTNLNQPVDGTYPILDPRMVGEVEGFSIDTANPAVSGSDAAAPMPVRWLYVLEDGEVLPATGDGAATARVAGATEENPIIGRVAFWTDDETSKVNINTASEGAFWDTPKSGSRDDVQFAGNPLVKNEFQRTPGHPSMTSLSAVFPNLLTADSDPTRTRWNNSEYSAELEAIYSLTPRIAWGGSRGGTYPVPSYDFAYNPPKSFLDANPRPAPVILDSDRMYATSDEFWFRPDRSVNGVIDSVADLNGRLFFLTASSRAPETTLFETPRISLWPITWPWISSYFSARGNLGRPSNTASPATVAVADNPWMTAEERLLAFCSTLNPTAASNADRFRYFFQRQNPDSPSHDWVNIPRNQQLVGYLDRQMSKPSPGWGASLESKWGAKTTDWLALSCFDFSRSLINQYTVPTLSQGVQYSYTGVSVRYGKVNGIDKAAYTEPNAKTVAPLRIGYNGTTHVTLGNYPRLEEVAVVFYAKDRLLPQPPDNGALVAGNPGFKDPANPYNWTNLINEPTAYPSNNAAATPNGYDNGTPGDTSDDTGSRTTRMRAVMLFDFTNLENASGFAPLFWIKVVGPSFSVNGSPINLPSSGGLAAQLGFYPQTAATWTLPLFQWGGRTPKIFSNSDSGNSNVWALVSDDITAIEPIDREFAFSGTPIMVEIYAAYSDDIHRDPTGDSAQLISAQEIDFSDWSGTLPIPLAPRWSVASTNHVGNAIPADQPNPAFSISPSAQWARTEYAPVLNRNKTPIPPPDRNENAIRNEKNRNHGTTYYFQGSGSIDYPSSPSDTDDAFDNDLSANPSRANRISSNFRKRIASLIQRNNVNGRTRFYIEGSTPYRPPSYTTSLPTDAFVVTSDEPLYESAPLISPYDTVISMVTDPSMPDGADGRLERFLPLSASTL